MQKEGMVSNQGEQAQISIGQLKVEANYFKRNKQGEYAKNRYIHFY